MTRLVYAGMTTGRQVKTPPLLPPISLSRATQVTHVATNACPVATGDDKVAVVPLTCQLLLPFHPPDGGDGFAADGRAGELRLVALADHVLAALDDRAARRDCVGEILAFSNSARLSGTFMQKNVKYLIGSLDHYECQRV